MCVCVCVHASGSHLSEACSRLAPTLSITLTDSSSTCASVRQSTECLVSSGLSQSASCQSVCLSFSLSFSFSYSPHTPQPSSIPALCADIPQLLLQPRPSPLFPFSQAIDFEPMLAGSFHRCLKHTASSSHLEMCFFPPFSLALSATEA